MIKNEFSIKLVWVKGHSGVKENVIVDECARLTQKQNPLSYNYEKHKISPIFKHIIAKVMEAWEKEYSCYKNDWLKKFKSNQIKKNS